jgi:hypothetical protein
MLALVRFMRNFWLFAAFFLFPFFLLKASPAELRKADQALAQSQIRIIHTTPLKLEGQIKSTTFAGRLHSVISEKQLLQLDLLLRSRNFANDYKKDGCYAKAHLLSYELSRMGLQHSKALIYGREVADITIIEKPKVYWFKFHISPLVLVQLANGDIKPFILDLSFATGPISLEAWTTLILKSSKIYKLKKAIVPPEQVDDEWVLEKHHMYSIETLFRFETEVDALNFLLKNARP